MDKKERFVTAYKYAYSQGLINSQKDLAKKMGSSEPNISSALKGVPSVLTDRFLTRFCELFPIFRIEWLIFGTGEMLEQKKQYQQLTQEQDLIALASSLIKEVEALRLSLSEEIKQTMALRQELTEALRDIRMTAAISNGTLKSQYLAERQPSNDSSKFTPPASQPYHVKSKKSV